MKKAKTIKLLADGSVAKVGRIVVIGESEGGNKQGTVTKITGIKLSGYFGYKDHESVFCKNMDKGNVWAKDKYKTCPKEASFYELFAHLRPATKEERQQYYASLTN